DDRLAVGREVTLAGPLEGGVEGHLADVVEVFRLRLFPLGALGGGPGRGLGGEEGQREQHQHAGAPCAGLGRARPAPVIIAAARFAFCPPHRGRFSRARANSGRYLTGRVPWSSTASW